MTYFIIIILALGWGAALGVGLFSATALKPSMAWGPRLLSLRAWWPAAAAAGAAAWLLDSLVLGLAVGGLVAAWPAWRKQQRRAEWIRRLGEQLPSLFESLSGALRAGQSLSQALASAAEDLGEPAQGLMQDTLQRVRLGEEPELALKAAGATLEGGPLGGDWRMLVTAVAVVRGTGGNLAEILDQLAATVRERQRLAALVRAQTAQARLSALVIGLLPPALLLAMQMVDPDLAAPLFNSAAGFAILGGAALLELAGLLVLRRMTAVAA
jgi:tight adherence protein B